MRSNSSHGPMAVRFAINGEAPALSAVTKLLFAFAWKLTLPSPLWVRPNVSHWPTAVLLAISGDAPALSAVTIMLLACDRKLTTCAAAELPSRPMVWLPRCLAEVAGLPLIDANGSAVVGDEVSSTR